MSALDHDCYSCQGVGYHVNVNYPCALVPHGAQDWLGLALCDVDEKGTVQSCNSRKGDNTVGLCLDLPENTQITRLI